MKGGKGFGIVPTHLRSHLTAIEIAVYVALSWRADNDGSSWPSHATIAAEAGTSLNSVKRALESLRSKGLVRWEARTDPNHGGPSSNRYWIELRMSEGGSPDRPTPQAPVGYELDPDEPDPEEVRTPSAADGPGEGSTLEPSEAVNPDIVSGLPDGVGVIDAELVETPTTQTLVGEWLDHCEAKPPGRVIGQVSKEVKRMLDEGIEYERVRSGVAEWHQRGLHPSTLPSVVHQLSTPQQRSYPRKQAETDAWFARAADRLSGGNPLQEITS